MSNDPSLIIALAALALSILSPLASAWISGHYRIKEIELQQKHEQERERQSFYIQHRAEVIEKYIRSAGAVIYAKSSGDLREFGEVAGEIYFYLDKSEWTWVEVLNDEINRYDWDGAKGSLFHLCEILAVTPPRSDDRRDDGEENDSGADGKKDQHKKEWRPKRFFQLLREKKARTNGGVEAKGKTDDGKDRQNNRIQRA